MFLKKLPCPILVQRTPEEFPCCRRVAIAVLTLQFAAFSQALDAFATDYVAFSIGVLLRPEFAENVHRVSRKSDPMQPAQ